MRHITSIKTVLLITALSASTGCLRLLGSGAYGEDASTGDCRDAVDACEEIVGAICGRIAGCTGGSFDDCVDNLLDNALPCERAVGADDPSKCERDLVDFECSLLSEGELPRSCDEVNIQFADELCR